MLCYTKLQVTFLEAGASSSTAATSDPLAVSAAAQHDKLQAVLAQARAIRGQPKAQTRRPHLSSIQPGHSTRSAIPSHTTQLNISTSKHDRVRKPGIVTDSTDGSVGSRHCHPARPTSKSQLPLPDKLLPDKPSASGKGTAKKLQSETSKEASKRSVPLQLPADFTQALNAFR